MLTLREMCGREISWLYLEFSLAQTTQSTGKKGCRELSLNLSDQGGLIIRTCTGTLHRLTSSFFFMHSIRMMKRCWACVRLYVNVFWMVTNNWSLKDSFMILACSQRERWDWHIRAVHLCNQHIPAERNSRVPEGKIPLISSLDKLLYKDNLWPFHETTNHSFSHSDFKQK